ncbi:Aldehyde dehydrogenase [Candidatus Rhodobacter oscarellae]|uniref:Aldehyde dehydrogenase n=1 Tax=Candidatus Rhodobacter oscarellae TaxID=1675527 RepID=A0A0J9GU81_9RHOB|nr:aldehyde dehydrogenase family protein [Candidatus Rhodobacter lobularis]KMW57108.1 Aldehyde dehydrogenase [Candidatus Rhodobacter lobularis]
MTRLPRYEKIFRNGDWVVPSATEFATLINPADGSVSGQAVRAGVEDLDRAVAAAKAAFPARSQVSVADRVAYLQAFATEYEKHVDRLERAVMTDIGAPIGVAKMMHAGIGIEVIRSIIGALQSFEFDTRQGSTLVTREPVGVVGLIAPWNGPAVMFCGKVCSAIAAGCTIVFKPAELATHSAMVLAEALVAAGLPDGVFNLVLGKGSVVGEAMSTHPDIDYISFTGSTQVGTGIGQKAAAQAKKVGLELGGKSAFIVLPEVDINKAATDAVMACMLNSGQICAAGTRTLVPADIYEEFTQAMAAALSTLKVGLPESDAFIGPVASQHQWDTVQSYIRIGIDEGARLVAGGPGKPEGLEAGSFVKPTMFADVTNDMRIAREEIFGPVATIIAYDTVEQAVEIANDSPYGLSGYVYGSDHALALSVARRLRTGTVRVNALDQDPSAPWGGYKQSGIGREAGAWGIEDMLEVKSINNYFAADAA